MTKEEAYNILLKLRAWRAWGHSEQNRADRPELPSQKEIDQALDIFIEVLSQHSLPEDFEEAAEEYNKQVIEETKCHHNALTYAEGYEDALLLIPDAFKAGAEWQKAKMMEKAMEGKVFMSFAPGHNQMVMADVDLPTNTKVKVIIVKEDEK